MSTVLEEVAPTYVDGGKSYVLPNDVKKQQRLDAQSTAMHTFLGCVNFASLSPDAGDASDHLILDIGCGTGHATRAFARQYPAAKVVGIDLTPVPQRHPEPTNVSYVTGDIRDLHDRSASARWAGQADLVFNRLLVLNMRDWPGYVKEVAALVRPGGFVEMQDIVCTLLQRTVSGDGTVTDVDLDRDYWRAMSTAGAARGMDLACGEKLAGWMKDAGFEIVEERVFPVPLGDWMAQEALETRDQGMLFAEVTYPAMAQVLKMMCQDTHTAEDIASLQAEILDDAAKENRDGKFAKYHVVVGRKPA